MSAYTGFLKLIRGETSVELLKDPKAFTLLALIAYRARRNDAFTLCSLKTGEALIGDHKSCGLTQQEYRNAKQRLIKWNFATFKGTSKGTIARLIDSRVWDINADENNEPNNKPRTSQQRANNEPTTTNKNERIIKRKRNQEYPQTPKGAGSGESFVYRQLPT